MTAELATDEAMAKQRGRPKKPTGEGIPVRIDSDIVAKLKYLASLKDVPLSELTSGFLRPIADREFKKAGRDLMEGKP